MKTGDPYFDWLCIKAGIRPHDPKREYVKLAGALHGMIFKALPSVKGDENRAMDGLQLRIDFMNQNGELGSSTNRGPCTMFEMLVALAKRISYLMGSEESSHHTSYWFYRLIDNLGLKKLSDDRYDFLNGDFYVEDTTDRVVYRQYSAYGEGGLFPLKDAQMDQRGVEIWYQMQAWLIENSDISLD